MTLFSEAYKYYSLERKYQSGPKEGKPLHPLAISVMFTLFSIKQNNYHDVVAEEFSDLLYEREGVRL